MSILDFTTDNEIFNRAMVVKHNRMVVRKLWHHLCRRLFKVNITSDAGDQEGRRSIDLNLLQKPTTRHHV